jgi:hypothetical protein
MKMGNIASPWRYEGARYSALRSPDLRYPAISRALLMTASLQQADVSVRCRRGRIVRQADMTINDPQEPAVIRTIPAPEEAMTVVRPIASDPVCFAISIEGAARER